MRNHKSDVSNIPGGKMNKNEMLISLSESKKATSVKRIF
ncbi:hypothetical protein LEP1GSC036_2394 [Leptospira weilii str. 2006001853]|uniref:Uncharacterized protein n=1 Tax=Leptospira weilii str. 2006001853 TaxID=1001589 RepID=A0A828YVU2_9LEPT|nr:hypothetical protein LEP1GSC036_2394 [Leptospira weilii str. 2006001853]